MFKKKFNFEQRLAESTRIRKNYPNRVPVVIQRAQCSAGDVEDLKRHKYLVPNTTTVSQLVAIIRKRVPNLSADKSIFLFVNETTMPASSSSLMMIDDEHKDTDGFLYVSYAGESTFG
jgi:GABA(A) receptor-associated protein